MPVDPFGRILLYCSFIVASSLVGGWLPLMIRLTHTRMQLAISFVGGLMLGVGVLHLIPHALSYAGVDQVMWWLLIGLLGMFFLIRVFHFHQHGETEAAQADHDHQHASDHNHSHGFAGHHLNWLGVAIGLAIHTLIDGVALGAAVVSEHGNEFPGLSIFIVILLHKPLDALSITTLMTSGGWSHQARQIVNTAFALMCPLGALAFCWGVPPGDQRLIGCALAFSAGVFLCISLGDLLPEVHFHRHDRLKLSAALLLGIAAAHCIGLLERHEHQVKQTDSLESRLRNDSRITSVFVWHAYRPQAMGVVRSISPYRSRPSAGAEKRATR